MAYRVEVSKQAQKYIEKLDKPSRDRFAEQMGEICKDPLGNSKPIVNSDPPVRSSRVGKWRIVIAINDAKQVVIIAMVQPRGQVYGRI